MHQNWDWDGSEKTRVVMKTEMKTEMNTHSEPRPRIIRTIMDILTLVNEPEPRRIIHDGVQHLVDLGIVVGAVYSGDQRHRPGVVQAYVWTAKEVREGRRYIDNGNVSVWGPRGEADGRW